MPDRRAITVDGNEAAASCAYRLSEVMAIYPITPSSPMGELSDEWAAKGRENLWGLVPEIVEMQSEGGVAGAMHGAIQAGAMATSFTASQGLLLMIPNLYKIAGELTPFVLHVAARTVATHALSIFGDHSDVMACRQTGVALLASSSVQEAHDMAAVAHAATLRSRIPFLHFFDGFRTSHELNGIEELTDDDLRSLVDADAIEAHRQRALSPDHPVIRGTAQNPDTFFQAREACNPTYLAGPGIVRETLDRFASLTGRRYDLVEYEGHDAPERVVVLMGSGAETAAAVVRRLVDAGEKVGMVKVRLYRPLDAEALLAKIPTSVERIAVLDRTKEPGAGGEPLYLDVVGALAEAVATGGRAKMPRVIGGRYGLSSKEFTPAMVHAVFAHLATDQPRHGFTVGIVDDVTHLSIPVDESIPFDDESDQVRAVFYGLGADGTVGANKNSIKIIAEETPNHAQGYFVYDSKKSGAITVSHLRFGPRPIEAPYLLRQASFVGVHQWNFVDKLDVLALAEPGATVLLNSPHPPRQVWEHLPREMQETILEKRLTLHTIDAYAVAREASMGRRINTIMQTCFFAISGVLPRDEAVQKIKDAISKTYARKGREVVVRNHAAVDHTLAHLHEVPVPAKVTATRSRPPVVADAAPDFVKRVSAVMMEGKGDLLPVSAFPADGTWPTGTTKWEKRSIALDIPVWDPAICIQCSKCAEMCPHAAIRAKAYPEAVLSGAPDGFKSVAYKNKEIDGHHYTIQVAPDDCTGCGLCVEVCPAKDRSNPRHKAIDMEPLAEHGDRERRWFDAFLDLPEMDRTAVKRDIKGAQLLEPLFEYSGACAGCGETPYLKLLTQLFGDRLLIANATGCSSIYGGNLPTTPYTTNADGRGPAWSNSLFEDNAEFGFGFRLAVDAQTRRAAHLASRLGGVLGDELVEGLLGALAPDARPGSDGEELMLREQRERVAHVREKLGSNGNGNVDARELLAIADYLVPKSVWLVGGDGWAYDIGFGGLDHVLAVGRDVNVIVLDTEVYSNTGGQQSKATPLGSAAKFAVTGKEVPKKDLGLEAMSYGHVYVARIAMGAKDAQTVRAIQEAASYPGPSLVIAYSHCIAHGYDLAKGPDQQKRAVDSGVWPLYRFDPRRVKEGKPPLILDSGPAKIPVSQYMRNEARFLMVEKQDPARFKRLMAMAQRDAERRIAVYQQLAGLTVPRATTNGSAEAAPTTEAS